MGTEQETVYVKAAEGGSLNGTQAIWAFGKRGSGCPCLDPREWLNYDSGSFLGREILKDEHWER